MAACSGGIEWSNIVKPILSASYGSFNKSDVAELVLSIIRSKEELAQPNEKYETFYSTFCVLAADYISSNVASASKEEIEVYCKACRVLLTYLINRLQIQTSLYSTSDTNNAASPTLTIKQLLLPIKALCTATSQLQRTEQFALAAIMKNAKLPEHIKTQVPGIENIKEGNTTTSTSDGKPGRFDLSATILKQLAKPLHSLTVEATKTSNSESNLVDCILGNCSAKQNETFFTQKNIESLQALQAGDILIDICLNLPFLVRYIGEQMEFTRSGSLTMPTTYTEASLIRHSLQSLVNDVSVIWSTITLPVVEPLTDSKLKKLSTLSLSCLYAALSTSMTMNMLGLSSCTSPKTSSTGSNVGNVLSAGTCSSVKMEDDNSEGLAAAVVEKAILIFNHISNLIKSSTRAGGHILQNHVLLGAWLLITGINHQITYIDKPSKEDKSKSPSKQKDRDAYKVNLAKVQQGFSVLSLALTSQALTLVTSLFEDAGVEIVLDVSDVSPAKLDILANSTALQRVAKIFEVTTGLIHFFLYITPIIYRKGCSLKRSHKHNSNGDTYSAASDSTTYFDDDDMSCEEDSTAGEDDDSEPILGQWFEETLSSVCNFDQADKNDLQNSDSQAPGDKDANIDAATSVIPEKGEPTGYLTLARDIFHFMNNHFVMCNSTYVLKRVKSMLSEIDIVVLVALTRDLDRETGLLNNYYSSGLNSLFNTYSEALTLFTHNLLARNMLSDELQIVFLTYFEMNPYNSNSTTWPLLVYPRTLSILAQIIIMRSNKETACANIWFRVINTLVEQIVQEPNPDTLYEDLNIEHAQLLLFLFNFLTFMQKKAALLATAKGVVRVGQMKKPLVRESQFYSVSRLLLFFDHIVKHLYDPPSFLLEQVQWNLLGGGLHGANMTKLMPTEENKCPWKTLEENYRKYVPAESSIKPLFYNLSSPDFNVQEVPKLDGLAVNFLLGNPDDVVYGNLIEALFTIVDAINKIGQIETNDGKNPFSALCALQYSVSLAWRMLLQLPTCVIHLERIVNTRSESVEPSPFMLYASIWGPRCGSKAFTSWLKDALGKQTLNQSRELLLRSVADNTTRIKYDFSLLKNVISELIPQTETCCLMVSEEDLPSFFNLLLCDTLLCKLQVAIDDSASKMNENDLSKSLDSIMTDNDNEVAHLMVPSKSLQAHLIREMMPQMIRLAEVTFTYIRSSLLHQMTESKVDVPEEEINYTLGDLSTLLSVIAIAGSESNKSKNETPFGTLPRIVVNIFEKWELIPIHHFSAEPYANQSMPSISYAMTIMNFHMCALSGQLKFSINPSLKHLLYSVVQFIKDHLSTVLDNEDLCQKIVNAIMPMAMDMSTNYLYAPIHGILEQIVGAEDTEVYQVKANVIVFGHLYALLVNYASSTSPCSEAIQESLLLDISLWFSKLLGEMYGRVAIDKFFSKPVQNSQYGLHEILMTVVSSKTSSSKLYSKYILEAFNKLFVFAEKNSDDLTAKRLIASLLRVAKLPKDQIDSLFWRIIVDNFILDASSDYPWTDKPPSRKGTEAGCKDSTKNDSVDKTNSSSKIAKKDDSRNKPIQPENYKFLENLTNYVTKGNSVENKENLICLLLDSIVSVANHLLQNMKAFGFADLMMIMISLADATSAKGHALLFSSATSWLQQINEFIVKEETFVKLERGQSEGDHIALINAICILFNYISDIVSALSPATVGRATSPPWDTELLPSTLDLNADWPEELCGRDEEDGDSTGDDSEEDSLSSKLCTFTVTQKEFMNQHWYHCHTCKMVDKVGVCSICARVCHKGHDVTYAKYGNFFCDCGAKNNGTCQALTKRIIPNSNDQAGASHSSNSNSGSGEQVLHSSLRCKNPIPSGLDALLSTVSLVRAIPRDRQKLATLAKQLDSQREVLMSCLWSKPAVMDALLNITRMLLPVVEVVCSRMSPVGCHKRAKEALDQLHNGDKKFEYSDKLMVPTLGSQEGTFENVRMSFTGDQGQTIRQLISAHVLRRVAMCCLASPQGKRQHLVAVSHEKGKVTIHQLSAVLKQADSSKKKLTLARLSSCPIPFTVLSVTGNPCNEDFLAICGLRDCHVLTFNSNGAVADHLVLHPQLETGNFIIRAIWLPGSQTWLALVTADFVKIYDLGKDVLSPQYNFLVPAGKIRDVTFVCSDDSCPVIVIMSSVGYIYTQDMNDESSATQGPFYVTNTLFVDHPCIKDTNGQICAGGVSVYYSHMLKVLFMSYAQGKSFVAFLPNIVEGSRRVYEIVLNSSSKNALNSSMKSASSNSTQPLCQWSEVSSHPGLVFCMMQSNSNPVVLMMKPDTILIQEIKILPAKAKIMDMSVVRHQTSSTEWRTTLILLCEDGSLRLYMASMEQTGFWLSPLVYPASVGPLIKPSSKKKKATKTAGKPSCNAITFPVDFFEHCSPLTDVEFGGNDLLQIYNTGQIKVRLNSPGMYVVCAKSTGFSIRITNNDSNQVITGVRVLLGNQETQRSPSYVEVFGRTIALSVSRNRWFDIPLTRDESIRADNKLTVTFGPSQDPDSVTMVDSIKVYGKMKDQFGWPEDTEEITNTAINSSGVGVSTLGTGEDLSGASLSQPIAGPLDKVVCGVLEVLESCFSLMNVASLTSADVSRVAQRSCAVNLASRLLTLPAPFCIILHTKSLLASLFTTRQAYHNYKDTALLSHVLKTLQRFKNIEDVRDLDPEAFYQLVIIARSVVVSRSQNLGRFILDAHLNAEPPKSTSSERRQLSEHAFELVNLMVDTMWRLHKARPKNPSLVCICVPGLSHVETTVCALVEIIHSLIVCDQNESTINVVIKLYLDLLLCSDTVVSFATKLAIGHGLRPKVKRRCVVIPSPTRCSTPGPSSAEIDKQPTSLHSHSEVVDVESFEVPPPGPSGNNGSLNVEAILGAAGAFPAIDILQPDTDDETMVELAIALSLQDHEGSPHLQAIHQDMVAMQVLQNLDVVPPELQELDAITAQAPGQSHTQQNEMGHYSDATASAAGSDDEGSTAATDGSTLRTSPAEQGGSAESESGGSVVDSIIGEHNVSGRSSAYGDHMPETLVGGRGDANNINFQIIGQDGDTDPDTENEGVTNLHLLQIIILEKCIEYIPRLKEVGGVQIIPFMQVVFMLTEELDMENERDRTALDSLLRTVLSELNIRKTRSDDCLLTNPLDGRHSAEQKYQFLLLRFLSVLMSQVKVTSNKNPHDKQKSISTVAANTLHQAGVIDWCLTLHERLLPFWKSSSKPDDQNTVVGALLKSHPVAPLLDASPFFLRQYLKGHCADMFDQYALLLTEIVTRIPYQIQKHASIPATFEQAWLPILCEYMMAQQMPSLRRQVRKLLLYICGSKESYRHLRDVHALKTHMKAVLEKADLIRYRRNDEVPLNISLPYDALVVIVEHLKACIEIAVNRNANWQNFLMYSDEYIPNLFFLSTLLDEGVSHIILQLLQYAICGSKSSSSSGTSQRSEISSKATTLATPEDAKSISPEEIHCTAFVKKVHSLVDNKLFTRFIRTFMLETNSSNLRWQTHSLVVTIFTNSDAAHQRAILDAMWSMWFLLPNYGRRATQFVDLIGYFTIKCSGGSSTSTYIPHKYLENTLALLRSQNQVLIQHPNASLYSQLSQYVEMEGYYLESEPCLVCNNPEVPFTNIKLSSVKVDSKFTTTTQIVKLVTTHMINKISLRIGDLKRTKMVRTLNVYYNNRSVQAVVELKNKPALWHKAKKVTLTSGQSEAKIDFPLPIVACNLMIEYVDFYENLQASTETLQCPRCSAAVPSNPGVCTNCGENVFQCHKCRAINYDEKDPFLCHVCGFCKYAKFDYTLTAKQVCAIEPIDNDEDRKKITTTINQLLEKADRTYKTLVGMKPSLENLLMKICEHRIEHWNEDGSQSAASSNNAKVSRSIQMLAQKYCNDCETTFEELSRVIQKILICRKELVTYDTKQYITDDSLLMPSTNNGGHSAPLSSDLTSLGKSNETTSFSKCYGCASYVVEHCLTMLRALCANVDARKDLCTHGLLRELVEYNIHRGSNQMQEEVKQLLCLLTKDNPKTTDELCGMLMDHISIPLRSQNASPDLVYTVRPEINLLATMLQKDDSCWEEKAKCVLKIFLMATKESKSPPVMEAIILPCLNIIGELMKPEPPTSKKNKDKNVESLATVQLTKDVNINVREWIAGNSKHSYQAWKKRMPPRNCGAVKSDSKVCFVNKSNARKKYLLEKYFYRWKDKAFHVKRKNGNINLDDPQWLKYVLFNSGSRHARQVACNLIQSVYSSPVHQKKLIDVLTSFLPEINHAGPTAAEFLSLYQSMIDIPPWKQYLTLKGVLMFLADLFNHEIQNLYYLEQTTLTSDLAQGFVLKRLTELIMSFLDVNTIKQQYKGRLVGTVLNGYLALRRLVVQRTRIIDETQEKLLELLEEMTSGTETETKAFMIICIKTVEKCSPNDIRTPVFIFERLCSIIYPEENEIGEFYLSLEKDPQQEDFLQGRMLGNPYSSNEPGLGPLMRDVKNKICADCELVALLEDDNGMELLVNNKIISLDLPVKLVYKKVWLAEGGEGDAMRIVYRMRGLLGDATEEFVETLDAKTDQEVNNEQVYKMANVMAEGGGLEVMLERLATIRDVSRSQGLLQVLLKLMGLCVKVKKNQEKLVRPSLNTISTLLTILQMCLSSENDVAQNTLMDQILEILETILSQASSEYQNNFEMYSETCGTCDHVKSILEYAANVKASTLLHLSRVLAALTYGNRQKMSILTDHFNSVMNFDSFDQDRKLEEEHKLELFCNITAAIEKNALGNTLKDHLMSLGVVDKALTYITSHAPSMKSTFWRTDSNDWKEYISKPALKYILRFLTGLANEHKPTQMVVSPECITIIHRLEQVASDEHVGTLAENLLEALRTNPEVATRIENVREQTRAEKKRLAMAMREKQLGALGMLTNEKGQVMAEKKKLRQIEDLAEETGLVCVICREGYRFQPNKVLGIYTFTKRCQIEDFESKSRKTYGYSTVTHFNVVHVDCHMAAVRLARVRDEWESAALQNANTRCNGLLPLWGPQVPESAFANCLARHNTYLQECTGHRDITYVTTIHDLKLLLLKFAEGKSFHADAHGGGPQSNMQIIPYIMHTALYVINTTRCAAREEKSLTNYLECWIPERWIASSYESDGPYYWATFSLLLHSPNMWKKHRIAHLRRLLVLSHVRHVYPSGPHKLSDVQPKDFAVYKSSLMFYGLIDACYRYFFKSISITAEDQWPSVLADYIRHNDEALLKASEKIMAMYNEELLPCTCFGEFCDVVGLLDEISTPTTFIADVLLGLGNPAMSN